MLSSQLDMFIQSINEVCLVSNDLPYPFSPEKAYSTKNLMLYADFNSPVRFTSRL
ncbi:Uncharacterised protein [Shewanella algae]|uniref:Uncharacterized protein n=1 Tax=Shewanella algae TaxID=38313 RepID=A0A380ACY4_9GAMM|nr:Uncharacterised protein [Shewanella algae]